MRITRHHDAGSLPHAKCRFGTRPVLVYQSRQKSNNITLRIYCTLVYAKRRRWQTGCRLFEPSLDTTHPASWGHFSSLWCYSTCNTNDSRNSMTNNRRKQMDSISTWVRVPKVSLSPPGILRQNSPRSTQSHNTMLPTNPVRLVQKSAAQPIRFPSSTISLPNSPLQWCTEIASRRVSNMEPKTKRPSPSQSSFSPALVSHHHSETLYTHS